ncbi:polysaccharide pyruvyl transferase family protein [Gordonia sp. OPL2]|uniref:polysaccharide pyruvyl transferase family protein n=1 Tax=Gordonia sp. OPL2 TaxID=2486274 RepID=UPI0016551961|nr:polysaccharide pyruvyl transferase family protein [Gordonia sp. OPL2]ROZ85958.1 polysaccharide pyruvyl transferase family protein [Gordonia sp. OPL2]
MPEATIFVSISAADGNIGDVVIRRECLAMLSARYPDARLCVYVGHMSEDYIASVLTDTPDAQTIADPIHFVRTLAASVVSSHRTVFVVAPGPAFLGQSIGRRLKHLLLAAFAGVINVRGGTVLVLGRAVVGGSRFDLGVERALCRAATRYTTRDVRTERRLGRRARLVPDLAFRRAKVTHGGTGSGTLIVSVRGDRELPAWFASAIQSVASQANLQIVVATQVKSDAAANARLARRLGADHIEWKRGVSHREQETALVAAYAHGAVCVTDRLHVAILAAREGAIPVVYQSSGDTKLTDALAWVIPTRPLTPSGAGISADRLSEAHQAHASAVNTAARLIDESIAIPEPHVAAEAERDRREEGVERAAR